MEKEPTHLRPLPEAWEAYAEWTWRQRAELVDQLAEHLRAGSQMESVKPALIALSEDPKWEVRRAVADKLLGLEDEILIPLLAKLLNDPNRDVQRSASRIQRELRQGKARPTEAESDAESVEYLYAQLERKVGKRAANLARETAARQIELMIGPVVHDIKNAMQPIISGANDLLMPPTNRPFDGKQEAERIRDHAKRAHEMLKALLEYAKPMELHVREEVLADLIQHATQSSAGVFGQSKRPVRFRTDVNTALKVMVDRDGFSRALDNLLKNAAESFSHPDCKQSSPTVTVTAQQDAIEGLVRITVQDNGIGIPSEELDLLRKFRPGTRSSKPGSTGFGLANVARIIREHAGSLQLESVPNEGTTVTILLPISNKE